MTQSLTFDQATDEIFKVFRDAWEEHAPYPKLVDYQNIVPPDEAVLPPEPGPTPDPELSWARVTIQHLGGGQDALAGALGKSRFQRLGIVTVQVFTLVGTGLSHAHTLSKIVTDGYDVGSTPGGVWFRNVRMNEVGPDGDWYQVNVLADFNYTEIK